MIVLLKHSTRPTHADIERLFAVQRAGDPLGIRIHEVFAVAACFFAGWPTTYVEWAPLVLWIVTAIRMTGQWRILGPLAWDVVIRLLLGLVGWMFLSILWTAARNDPATSSAWIDDVASLRFGPMVVALYPVLERRGWLIAALIAGIACGQISQFVGMVGEAMSISWMHWHRMPGRNSGWWDPVVGGTVLCGALGLHLAPAIFGQGPRQRTLGVFGSLATLVCIVATGTRGAWIGAVLVIGVVGALVVVRSRHRARALVIAGVALVAGLTILAGTWLALGQGVRDRLHAGVAEVRGVFDRRDYSTDTGMRIAMWKWAVLEIQARPMLGTGAGGFRPWADQKLRQEPNADLPPRPAAHAHSWALHTWATLGIVGLALMAALVGSAMVFGLRISGTTRENISGHAGWHSGWQAGPALALAGLVCAGLFDPVNINQQTGNLLFILIALCLPTRPGVEAVRSAGDHARSNTPRSRRTAGTSSST